MVTELVLEQCVIQAMQLKNRIKDHCKVPYKCLGGEMKPMYEKVREHQTELADKVLRKLKEQTNNI